jgi:hypothetical protein
VNTTSPRAWRCPRPGCHANGAGYPSESAANRAYRRHGAHAHLRRPVPAVSIEVDR